MIVTRRGTNNPLLQRAIKRWSPQSGEVEIAEYSGHDQASMVAKAEYMRTNGFEYEMESRFGVHNLRAIDTRGEVTVDSWDVAQQKLSPDVLDHPVARAIFESASLLDDVLAGCKAAQDESVTIQSIVDNGYFDTISSPDRATLVALLELKRRGTAAFYSSSYVLRHTTNVSNRYAENISDVNVDCIYTPAQFLTEVQNASLWIYPLPGRLAYKLNSIPTPAARTNYLWGWLKSGSTENTTANNRVNIVTEYELAQWSVLLYASV